MQRTKFAVASALAACAVMLSAGCEDEKAQQEAEAAKAKAEAEAKALAEKTAQLAAAQKAAEEKPQKPARPSQIDTELTDERRSTVEAEYSEAKGFLVVADIEERLKKDTKIKAKEAATKAFDKTATGKWILISGPMVNLTDDGFDLAVTYTPRDPKDPMGMSRQFFTITLNGIEGYEKDAFKAGQSVVVLAKYDGNAVASKGYELVEAGHWK